MEKDMKATLYQTSFMASEHCIKKTGGNSRDNGNKAFNMEKVVIQIKMEKQSWGFGTTGSELNGWMKKKKKTHLSISNDLSKQAQIVEYIDAL